MGYASFTNWSTEKKKEKKKHYHIVALCSLINIPSVTVTDETQAMIELENMVRFIESQTGLVITRNDGKLAKFFDGSTVKYYECDKNCSI